MSTHGPLDPVDEYVGALLDAYALPVAPVVPVAPAAPATSALPLTPLAAEQPRARSGAVGEPDIAHDIGSGAIPTDAPPSHPPRAFAFGHDPLMGEGAPAFPSPARAAPAPVLRTFNRGSQLEAAFAAAAPPPVAADGGIATGTGSGRWIAPHEASPLAFATALERDASAILPDTTPVATSLSAPMRWLRLRVNRDSYAVDLLAVQEVVRLSPIVPMRGTPRATVGVMNLRGRVVPVFDLGLWLGAAAVETSDSSRVVVIGQDDELIGLLVGAVDDVVTLGRERIEPPLANSDAGPLLGIARVGDVPTVLLDAGAFYG